MPTKDLTGGLSPEEERARLNLRQLYDTKKKELGLTQNELAKRMGCTQGYITHLFNGRAALNMQSTVQLATHLKADPKEIYPELFKGLSICSISDEEFSTMYEMLNSSERDVVKQLLRHLIASKQ